MAKAASGETKAPIVIALVFFVLATIGAGVYAYTTGEDLATAKKAADEANKAKAAADTTATKAAEAALIYKVALGVDTEDDRSKLQGIQFKSDAQAVHKAMIDAIGARGDKAISEQVKNFTGGGGNFTAKKEDLFAWIWPADGAVPAPPANSVVDNAVTALAQRELAMIFTKAERDRLQKDTASMVAKSAEKETAVKNYKDLAATIPGAIAANDDKARKAYEAKAADFAKQQADARNSVQTASEKLAEKELQVKRGGETIANQARRLDDLLNRERGLIDPFQFDKPQGRILRRYSDSLVDIDLGSADKLRAGIAFSIFPSDTIIRGMQPRMRPFKDADGATVNRPIPKGMVEVIDVIGPNIAQCRIVDEDNAVRDRMIAGDLLYNASWRKGISEHVAIFGVFDLDGDGRDDTQTMIAGLRRVGVVVDAYYDLGKQEWVGEITSLTNYGLEGWYPTVSAADGNREGKMKVLNGIKKAREVVKEKGILILKPRDFFPRIGFNARLEVSEDAINQAANGFTRALYDKPAGAPAEGAAEPKEKN